MDISISRLVDPRQGFLLGGAAKEVFEGRLARDELRGRVQRDTRGRRPLILIQQLQSQNKESPKKKK